MSRRHPLGSLSRLDEATDSAAVEPFRLARPGYAEVLEMYPQPRKYLWYLALIVLVLFVFKSPALAGHLAHTGWEMLSAAAGALAKLAGAL
jgi:hypothetical protein